MITVQNLAIPDVKLLTPKLHRDDRGYVAEVVHERQLAEVGVVARFPQENQSMSLKKNTVRGLHSQKPPNAQAKLVRVLQGRIFDVAVDVRPGSKTYGHHVSAILSSDDVTQMLVPIGFLHGFCTLEDDTVVLYKMSDFYAPGTEVGALWNDPEIAIKWPIDAADAILSGKDGQLPPLKEFPHIEW